MKGLIKVFSCGLSILKKWRIAGVLIGYSREVYGKFYENSRKLKL